MFTKMRLCAVALVALGAILSSTHQAGACHGSHGTGHHSYSQSSVVTAAEQPASLQQQAALVAKVQQTSASFASEQRTTSSSAQGSVLPSLQQKQLAVRNALQATLQRGNGRLTRSQLQTFGRQESAIVAQFRAMHAGTIK
jgi:hypothetical protein